MTTLPIKPVKMPLSLRGKQNGRLPAKVLTTVAPNCTMHVKAARAWTAMREAAAKDGVQLAHVGDYRPYDRQVALFRERYQTTPTSTGDVRTWNGVRYWRKPGVAAAAVPGTSNHGWGLAVDVALRVNGQTVTISADPDGPGPVKSGLAWLLNNAARFGFSWELQSEPWHIRYVSGSRLPKAVLAYEAKVQGR